MLLTEVQHDKLTLGTLSSAFDVSTQHRLAIAGYRRADLMQRGPQSSPGVVTATSGEVVRTYKIVNIRVQPAVCIYADHNRCAAEILRSVMPHKGVEVVARLRIVMRDRSDSLNSSMSVLTKHSLGRFVVSVYHLSDAFPLRLWERFNK